MRINIRILRIILVLVIVLTIFSAANAQQAITIINNAPDFTAKTLDGKSVTLSELKGKVVLVTFWATWCPFCAKMLPRIEKELWQPNSATGNFVFLAIAPDDAEAKVRAHVRKKEFTFPIIADPKKEIYTLFTAGGMPMTYLINTEGKIIAARAGYSPKGFEILKEKVNTEIQSLKQAKK